MSQGPTTWNQPPEPPARKSGSKLWLYLGIGLGVCVLLCCGGIFSVVYVFRQNVQVTEDPAEVTRSQQELLTMQIPPELPPQARVDVKVPFSGGQRFMLMIVYGREGGDEMLMLAEFGPAMPNSAETMRSSMEDNMKQQSKGGGGFRQLTVTSEHDVDVTVNGKPATIKVMDGTDPTGKKFYQARGVFDGKEGKAMLLMQLDGETRTVEQVDEIIKSMK